MKPFEFVLVMISVILGMSLTESAIGIAWIIQNHRTVILYAPYLAFVIYGISLILTYWGSLYKLRNFDRWTIPQFASLFFTALCLSVATKIFFPEHDSFSQNYKQFFYENINAWYSVGIGLTIVLAFETYFVRRLRRKKPYMMFAFNILLILSALLISNADYKALIPFILLLGQVYIIYSSKIIIEDK
jgi:hypothetical protein